MPDDLLPDLVTLVRAETADSLVLRALAMADELERTRADLRAARDALGAAPIIAGPSAVALAEGATSLGTWASSKPGTWSASGPDAGLITVPPGPSAACSPAFAAAPNFEAPSDAGADRTYDFTLRCTDGAGTVGTLAVAATITNVPEVMLGSLALSSSTMAETASAGAAVGAVLGLAAGGAWSLADDAGGRFARSGTTLVRGATALDWETAPVIGGGPARGYPVTLRETHPDAEGGSRDTTLMIQVTNVPEVTLAPLTLSASAVAENVAPGTVVARVQGLTAGGSWTLSNTAGGRLSRSGTSILAGATPIDFETGPSLAWAVTETHPDAASPRVTSGTIAVTDVAEAPPTLSSLRISSYLLDAGAGSTTQAVADATGAVPLTRGPTSAVEGADPAWTAQGMHFAGGRILRSDPAASTAVYGGVTNLTLLAVVRRRTATFGATTTSSSPGATTTRPTSPWPSPAARSEA
jgi:hypothetical protein